jgi:hypothetical protein
MYSFNEFKTEILRLIWENSFKPGSIHKFSISELDKVLPPDNVCAMAEMSIDTLLDEGLLEYHTDYSPPKFSLSVNGIRFAEFVFGDEASPDKPRQTATRTVPTSDRVVELNHNSDPYTEAIRALDAAVSAFRNDHCLENEWGSEKAVLLQSIEAGQRLLKESQVRVATIYTTVVSPLRIIVDRYKDAVAAGLITAGVDQIIPIFERAVHSVLALIGIS